MSTLLTAISKMFPETAAQSRLANMKTVTYEATVENGQIRLPSTARLPEHAKVFVVAPGNEEAPASRINSPRLADPEQAPLFIKEVSRES